ncbi:hypothetical protein HpBGD46_15230 [Helicobacter pylori]
MGKTIKVAGWCNTYRDHGGVVFIDLRDKSGFRSLLTFDPPERKDKGKLGGDWCTETKNTMKSQQDETTDAY